MSVRAHRCGRALLAALLWVPPRRRPGGAASIAFALDAPGQQRRTALTRAAAGGHAQVVTALLEAGANPGLRDADGRSAADLARQLGRAEALAALEAQPRRRFGGLF